LGDFAAPLASVLAFAFGFALEQVCAHLLFVVHALQAETAAAGWAAAGRAAAAAAAAAAGWAGEGVIALALALALAVSSAAAPWALLLGGVGVGVGWERGEEAVNET